MRGIDRTMLLIIFSLFFLAIVITVAATVVYPMIRWGIFSPCWGSFSGQMGSFTTIEFLREPQTITVGDCVGSIMFVNKEAPDNYFTGINEDYMKELRCEGEGASYIIGFPTNDFKPDQVGWNVFKWPKKLWQEMKDLWLNELGGIGPICKIMDSEKEFTKGSVQAVKDQGVYCIEIKLTSDKKNYEVVIDDGSCKDSDRKKDVGVPIN